MIGKGSRKSSPHPDEKPDVLSLNVGSRVKSSRRALLGIAQSISGAKSDFDPVVQRSHLVARGEAMEPETALLAGL